METRRWLNPTQPQTLQIAVMLLYINAVFLVLFGGVFTVLGLVFTAGYVAGGYGIANERKWGYGIGVALAFLGLLPYVEFYARNRRLPSGGIINLMFEIALVVLLLHPQSRDYQRIWFK